MTPQQLIEAASEIKRSWPDALIYPNGAYPNRNLNIPQNALAVDVDAGDMYQLFAWIDIMGGVHYMDDADGLDP